MVDIKIRSAKENDSKDIFEWRNDELTRQMSHTSEIIEWENHSRWYSNSLDSESRILLICEDDRKEKIAIIRLDISELNEVLASNLVSDPYYSGDEIQLILQKAIATLPQKQRLVFNMKYFDDLKYNEISEILETSVGALKASYYHAVKKIENYIKSNTN